MKIKPVALRRAYAAQKRQETRILRLLAQIRVLEEAVEGAADRLNCVLLSRDSEFWANTAIRRQTWTRGDLIAEAKERIRNNEKELQLTYSEEVWGPPA
jgi:hypothetical protein